MNNTIADLSRQEFESLVEHIIDRRMSVWLTQLIDAIGDDKEEREATFQPEFAASLQRSVAQARKSKTTDLKSFRQQLTNG